MKVSLKARLRILAGILVTAVLLASCQSINLSKMTDDELVAAGVDLWNNGKATDAKPYWNSIRDAERKADYLQAFDALESIHVAVEEAEAVPASKPEDQAKAFGKARDLYKGFPTELQLPTDLKPRMEPLTVNVVKTRVRTLKFDAARTFAKDAGAFLGSDEPYKAILAEIDSYNDIAAKERDADRVMTKTRDTEDFNDMIAGYESSQAAYRKVEDASAVEMKKFDNESILVAQNSKIRKKRADARVEMERQLRDRAYSFRERIGEEFARQPEPDKIGKMKPEDLLRFNEERRKNIEAEYQEMVAFGNRYPTVIDKDMIKDVEAQKNDLDRRIAIIVQEVKTARDIESRGKAALPLMIGLFNPQPGTKEEEKKSRPAILKGTMTTDKDYWWGFVSIDKGALNDLVVTMKDGRTVEIYAENTLSGKMIAQKGLKSLVSMKNKVGTSWPVINAAAVLPKSQYYIQLDKGSNATYSGEVVVYSSFIARMR